VITCIAVDDEPMALDVIERYCSKTDLVELKAVFREPVKAITYLAQEKIDLIFLDIHLPKLKGMAFLKTLVHPPAVIITTAYHQYAVEGFDLNVTDYLLKPFEFERFLIAVNKVKTAQPPGGITKEERPGESAVKDFIFLNAERKKVKILFA